jgi:preprotein translocase subunit SecD
MRKRRLLTPLITIVMVAAIMLGYTFAAGNVPFLGLDLQGGVSVVLRPTEEVDDEALNQAIEIMRQRIDALGVAEPEITRQGDNILVQIPGVEDTERAIELVGQTAELRFRPVLSTLPPEVLLPPAEGEGEPITVTPEGDVVPGESDNGEIAPTDAPATEESGLRSSGPGEQAAGAQQPPDTVSDEPSSDTTLAPIPVGPPSAQDPTATASPVEAPSPLTLPPDVCRTGVPPELDIPDQPAVLPQCDGSELVALLQVGPVMLTGETLEGANASLDQSGRWIVNPTFRPGAEGIDQFNQAAGTCFNATPECPSRQLAIVLDGRVISAPTIQVASFQRDQIQISGDFSEGDARDLATALKYGALPVELEQQQAQIVSATLGRDALDAGLWAGGVGLLLVTAYMLFFYRILGALAIAKLAVEGALIWSIVSYLGANQGLALTLAGVTGLIVSIGVSVDSNVVYYEHLKADVRHGRTIRSAADKSFTTAYRTIVAADLASLIGAVVLYWFTVGPVRGFAFYLGLATIIDLIAAYFFMRPAVGAATRSKLCAERPSWFGLPAAPITSEVIPPEPAPTLDREEVTT